MLTAQLGSAVLGQTSLGSTGVVEYIHHVVPLSGIYDLGSAGVLLESVAGGVAVSSVGAIVAVGTAGSGPSGAQLGSFTLGQGGLASNGGVYTHHGNPLGGILAATASGEVVILDAGVVGGV